MLKNKQTINQTNKINENQTQVPQTISYLIMQSLEEGARAVNVKRLYEFRSALLLLDFQDQRYDLFLGI